MKAILVSVSLAIVCTAACGPVPTAGAGGTGGTGGTPGDNPFCEVKRVLNAKCTGCHAEIPNSGAPMKLTSYAAAQPYAAAIAAAVSSGVMPKGGVISAADKAILVNWGNSGGPGRECAGPAGDTCATNPNFCVGEQFLPCTPDIYIKAHAPGNVNQKYVVPAFAADKYNCYRFKNPFYGTNPVKYEIAEAPVIDNTRVIHHWLLFGAKSGTDGSIDESGTCVGPETRDTLLSGWAPGGTNSVYPADIGLSLEQFPILTLQVHYNNPTGVVEQDGSGIAICSTTNKPEHIAGQVTLGQDLFLSAPAGAKDYPGGNGTCTNMFSSGSGTATIVNSWGHMHKLGSGFTTELMRGGQRVRYVTNIPLGTWSFDQQKHYPHHEMGDGRVDVLPGDVLKTTCSYTNPTPLSVGFGTRTIDEMCYDFIVAYPIAQLRRGCGALTVSFRQ